ncbi:MAG: hypothetical protein II729_07460, partial [Ruminococcus sp.]|nr:hypothetical protein [Ruminococcus sp.]
MKKYNKMIAGVLAVAISAGATGTIAYAKNTDKNSSAEKEKEVKAASESSRPSSDDKAFKDETVYVLCNNDSSVKNIIVSDWLKNAPALSSLDDISELSDIVNVKGDEEFKTNGNGLEWSADGNDIYYKGKSDKELPVDVTMTYLLDGKEVSANEIAGKSGHVTIRWTYKNKQKVTKNINGKDKDIYVPFTAATAAFLDPEKFVNVEVSNGKIISDGNRLIIIGLAFPGINDTLGLDELEGLNVKLPESFEISADVKD